MAKWVRASEDRWHLMISPIFAEVHNVEIVPDFLEAGSSSPITDGLLLMHLFDLSLYLFDH